MSDQLKLRLEREDKEDGSITYHLWSVDGDWIVGLNDDETKQGGKSRSYANTIVRAVNAHDDLVKALKAALEWIDAVPSDAPLPTMPGFDRDDVNVLLDNLKAAS